MTPPSYKTKNRLQIVDKKGGHAHYIDWNTHSNQRSFFSIQHLPNSRSSPPHHYRQCVRKIDHFQLRSLFCWSSFGFADKTEIELHAICVNLKDQTKSFKAYIPLFMLIWKVPWDVKGGKCNMDGRSRNCNFINYDQFFKNYIKIGSGCHNNWSLKEAQFFSGGLSFKNTWFFFWHVQLICQTVVCKENEEHSKNTAQSHFTIGFHSPACFLWVEDWRLVRSKSYLIESFNAGFYLIRNFVTPSSACRYHAGFCFRLQV